MQQNLIVPAVERSLSGVVLNVDSLEETIAVQNADLQDLRKYSQATAFSLRLE